MNELIHLLETATTNDLSDASNGTVVFIGKATSVQQDRPIVTGLRTWTLVFAVYAVPMK
jgi:hypothetical protein